MCDKTEEEKTTSGEQVPLERVIIGDVDIDYKDFYEQNRIPLLQYENLRKHFQLMVNDILGKDYYNYAMDVYECDKICCLDITHRAKTTFWQRNI